MAKGRGTGKPCGASHIAADKVCRVSMPSAIGRALNAATGEIGANTLYQAAKAVGPGNLKRYHEIRLKLNKEVGGNIVKGARADEFKKRLQEAGVIPNGKPKSVAPEEPVKWEKGQRDRSVPPELKAQIAALAAQGQKKPEVKEWKPDSLWGDWDDVRLQKMQRFFKNKEEGPKRNEQLARIDKELARRQGQVKVEGKGKTDKEMEDLSRIMRGESPKYMDIVSAPGELGAGARMKSSGNANTAASTGTKYARESARDFDDDMRKQDLRRDGNKTFDKWSETSGSGAKKLGQGAYGTVIKSPDNSYAVKRGDISDTEARLIQKLGDRDLGPKLIAADVDGPGRSDAPGVNNRRGRLAMSVVPGKPIGQSAPDKEVGGVKVADAYWKARADLHRMGIAHNDMHIDNVLVDKKGKGRFVDMGLAQDVPKAALAEALGAFDPPRGGMVTRPMGVKGQGDWQARRWEGTGGRLLARATRSETDRKELEQKAPLAARALDNKNELQYRMQKDGFSKDDIATMMDHGLRNDPSTYNQGVWQKVSDQQAMEYINILYEGI